jgi:replicative DNA helicase
MMTEQSSNNTLEYSHINSAINSALAYIKGRREGEIKSLLTGSKKVNNSLLNGIEWNRIFTIAAMSGSGKSTYCEQLKRELIDLNPEQEFDILSFEFEMPSSEQVLRNISGKTKMSVSDLLSSKEQISEKHLKFAEIAANSMRKYPIYNVENTGTIEQIVNTILSFVDKQEIQKRKRGLIITIDHVLLTKGKTGQDERNIVAILYRTMVDLKKQFIKMGIPILIILLSQLNRNIETPERILNSDLHFPTRNDLFGSSDIFMCSDYVLVIHKPALLGLVNYGKPLPDYPKGFPVWNPKDKTQAMIYFHLLKQRTGIPKVLMMLDNFKNSSIDESN